MTPQAVNRLRAGCEEADARSGPTTAPREVPTLIQAAIATLETAKLLPASFWSGFAESTDATLVVVPLAVARATIVIVRIASLAELYVRLESESSGTVTSVSPPELLTS